MMQPMGGTRSGLALLGLLLLIGCLQGCPQDATESPDAPEEPLASPRATLLHSFLIDGMNRVEEGDESGWERVIATLDVALVESDTVRARARRLLGIINRLGRIGATDLPNAADIARTGETATSATKQPIRRYRFFPTEDHAWVYEGLGSAPDGEIVLAADEAGHWRFSAETVLGVDVLYDSMKQLPPRFVADATRQSEELFNVIGSTFQKTSPSSWGVLLLTIFVGLVAGKIVQVMLLAVGARGERRGWQMRAIVFTDMASPASLALLAAALRVGLHFIYMEEAIASFRDNVITFLLILSIGWYLFNLVDVIDTVMQRMAEKTESKLDDHLVPLVRKTLRIFLVILFTLVVAQNVLGLDITGWLAGLGIAGLAVSLAAQDSVKNLFGSVTIFFDNPFAVGDMIVFDGHRGTVEEIGFRSTRLRLLSGHLVTVPNMRFIDSSVENVTARPYIRREMNVTITYDTPPKNIGRAVEIMRDILHDADIVRDGGFDMEQMPPRIAFNELNADSLNIRVYYWYQFNNDPDRGFFTYLEHCQRVNMMLFNAYGDAGIEFAFPTQTLYLAGDPNRRLAIERQAKEETAGS